MSMYEKNDMKSYQRNEEPKDVTEMKEKNETEPKSQ